MSGRAAGGADERGAPGGTPEGPRPPVAGRLGILGGTFDPIHYGHLAIAEAAREALGLERVLFVPARQPPHRSSAPAAGPDQRAAMVALAIAGQPAFELSRIELDRAGASYTVDTLNTLDAAERRAGRIPDLWFILSSEAFAGFATWHEPGRIASLCRLAVLPRDGHPEPDLAPIERDVPALTGRVTLLDGPHIRLAATEIRGRAAAGLSVRYLVPDAVAAYIAAHSLYRGPVRDQSLPGGTSAP